MGTEMSIDGIYKSMDTYLLHITMDTYIDLCYNSSVKWKGTIKISPLGSAIERVNSWKKKSLDIRLLKKRQVKNIFTKKLRTYGSEFPKDRNKLSRTMPTLWANRSMPL